MFFVLQFELIVLAAILLGLASVVYSLIKILKSMNALQGDFLILIKVFHKEFEQLEKKVGELKK